MDEPTMLKGISLFLEGLGIQLDDQHFCGTPERIVKAWTTEFGKGHNFDYECELEVNCEKAIFLSLSDEMIIIKDIPFLSHCAHHLVPFVGTAKIGYVPGVVNVTTQYPTSQVTQFRIMGLSKFARIIDHFSSKLQIQEILTQEIADFVHKLLKPLGFGIILEAEHFCMCHRGIKKPGSKTVTSCLMGVIRDDPRARSEFLSL